MSQANILYWEQAVKILNPQVAYMTDWYNAWDKDGNPVEYDHEAANVEANKLMALADLEQCSSTAKRLIAYTDWSALPDVNLANKSEFESYRATLRSLIINPVPNPVWPVEPKAVWVNQEVQ